MNKFNVKMPMGTIRTAVKALNEARQELKRLSDQKADYESQDANRRYSQEHIERELVRISAEAGAVTTEIQKKINGLCETIQSELDAAFIPDGTDLIGADNEADAALFKNGLIFDPKTLEYMVNKHDNAAFRILAANYAKERKWENFDYITSEESAHDYINAITKGLKNAASVPFGYDALRFAETKGEYSRMATEYGLSEEYRISDGDTIDTAIIEPIDAGMNG